MNPRTQTYDCDACGGTGYVPGSFPLSICTAPGCTLGRVPVVMPRLPLSPDAARAQYAAHPEPSTDVAALIADDPRAELDRMRAALEEWGDRAARAEERALAAEQERDQWRERCGVLASEVETLKRHLSPPLDGSSCGGGCLAGFAEGEELGVLHRLREDGDAPASPRPCHRGDLGCGETPCVCCDRDDDDDWMLDPDMEAQ